MDTGRPKVSFQLCFEDREISAEVTLPAGHVTLQEMLPVFQAVADAIAGLGMARAGDAGAALSCRMRCAHCCRLLVPVSEPEARHLAQLVAAMPPARRVLVRQRFAAAMRRAEEAGLGRAMRSQERFDPQRQYALLYAYADLRIPCPFLEDELCTIYPDRPLQCREYLMLTPPENCRRPRPETVRALPLPVRPSKALLQLGEGGPFWIPHVLALEWCQENPERDAYAAPAAEILRRFLEVLQTT